MNFPRAQKSLRAIRLLAASALLFGLTGCAGIRQMGSSEKAWIRANHDTIYVKPARADFRLKGIVLSRRDTALTARTAGLADSVLRQELTRAFPGAVIVPVDSLFAPEPGSRVPTVTCEVRAYRRTLPREILSSTTDVVLMIPMLAFNLGYPVKPSSRVRLQVVWPTGRPLRLKHADEVRADLPGDLGFQIHKLLDPEWRG
jgi:hypothetical protein